MNHTIRLLAGLLCALGLLFAQADANKGQIIGTVYDAKQASVPEASVKVRNVATGLTRDLTTNAAGQYRAVQLDPGPYEIVAQSAGFAASTIQGITVTVGSAVGVDIVLQVQSTTTTVEVSDTLINVAMPAPSTTLNTSAITNLPINGRRFQDFAVLTPTVQVDPSRSQLSFAGQRGINSNIMVDGADYNQPFFGGIRGGERSNSVITVPQSSVQEFQAITTGYSAEYGRSTGGILNVISKSGTNSWHGEGFYQNRNSELSKAGPIPVNDPTAGGLINVKPAESLQQWGAGIGGPLKRDKLFLFTAYEQQHAVQPRRVLFPSLLNYTPTAANKPAYDFYKGLEGPFNKTNNAGAGTVKADYTFNNGSRLTLRYNRSGSEEVNAVTAGGAIEAFTNNALTNEGTEQDKLHFGSAQYTAIISPAIVNDFKFSGSYEQRPRLANAQTPGLIASTIGTYGTRNFLPTIQDDRRFQITDSISVIRGAHSFKFGTDISKLSTGQTFGFDQFGTFTINGSNVGTLLDIISGAGSVTNRFDSPSVSYSRQIGNLSVQYAATQAALFAQDSWRVTRTLTFDLGMRWEGQWSPQVDGSNTTLVNKVDGFTFPNNARTDVTKIPNALKQFMPRFGFAWNPLKDNKLVIRGNTGIFYAATPLLIYSDPTGNFRTPPNNVRLFLNNTKNGTIYQQFQAAGVDFNQFTPDKLPIIALDAVQHAAAFGLGSAPDPFLGAAVTTVARDFVNPRSFQVGTGAEYRVTNAWSTGVQLNYVNTVHLERNRDYNLPVPVIRPTDASKLPYFGVASGGTNSRPISSLGGIGVRESSARSMYRGITISNQYRGKKLQAGVFYTAAQAYSDDDNERDSGGQTAMNAFNYQQDYGFSNLDARHTFSSYAVYSLPWGFEVSGVFRARSGLPMNPRTGADTNGDGASTDRALQAPGVPFARNSFRNRAIYGDDLRVMKNFKLGETRRIQLSAEFFNLFNIDNVVYGGTTSIYGLGVNSAGATVPPDARWLVLKTSDGRYNTQNQQVGFPLQVQFGARFFF